MYNHISDAIKTPHIIKLTSNLYIARFESMKIYSTLYAVETLLKKKVINKKTILIDSSSGIYAYALALACHKFKLKCHIIASNKIDDSTMIQLKLLGAYVERIPSNKSLKFDQECRIKKIQKILKENSNYYWMKQYHDGIHYKGYKKFAQLILKELYHEKKITIVGGVGSGCSTGALATFLRDEGILVRLCALQPFGSVTFGAQKIIDPENIVSGIGSAIEFLNVRYNCYNCVNWLSFEYCLNGTIELMKKYAIFAGISSGGSYCVGKLEVRLNPNTCCLIIAPDTGYRYLNLFSLNKKYKEVDELKPKNILKASELSLPWSKFEWNRGNKEQLAIFCKG